MTEPGKVTEGQLSWLNRYGGRTVKDVEEDEKGLFFVYMKKSEGGYERVYIPVDQRIPSELVTQ